MIVDFDDLGANHIINDQCQSHDCRDKLDQLHYANNNFKVTLFAIPGEMTAELANWCKSNNTWVELAVHGFFHSSNYECAEMTYEEFDEKMQFFKPMLDEYFVNGFKAPGWQISDDCFKWLAKHKWWVGDQSYNNVRRPKELKAYVNNNGGFVAWDGHQDTDIDKAWHGHTWDCVGNGIYETYDQVEEMVKSADSFQFVSEVLND
jgi:hypothetical protein